MSGLIRFGRSFASLAPLALACALARPADGWQECTYTTVPTARHETQPDGSVIELYFRGNGANHWYEDAAGHPVVKTDGGWFYARRGRDGRLVASEGLVGASDPRQLGIERKVVPTPARRAGTNAAVDARGKSVRAASDVVASPGPRGPFQMGAGSVDNLVLLLRFSNHGPAGQNRTLPSVANVTTIMNAVGGDPILAPTGSVRDHYLENSYGQFAIDSTVVGWLDMPDTEAYYANGSSGLTTLTWDLIVEGLDQADALVDFTDFDTDGDGWIDAITFLHSGYGAEWGGEDQYGTDYVDRMWSHKWTIPTWTSAEGVRVGDYNISPGLWGLFDSEPGHIGVVVHELGHFFGLPDLYDTDGSSYGNGYWCVMSYGSWGFDGTQQYPSHMCAWCKLKLGWAEPIRLLPGSYSAQQIETNQSLFMIDSGYPSGEYLLVENRQQVGFDSVIPQGGLAIWHIDEGKGSFSNNDPNNDEGYPGQFGWPGNNSHVRVALLQADGDYAIEQGFDAGDSGDVYRAGFATVIDAATTPDTDAYQGGTLVTNSNRLQGIGASSANMAFTYVNSTAPTITTASLPTAFAGIPYSVSLTRSGGSAPFTWTEFRDDPSYSMTDLGPQTFTLGGTAQGFNADEGTWAVNLPFQFPYYETGFSRVFVSPNGCVDLAPLENEYNNTTPSLRLLPRIAGLWDDLVTDGGIGQDIYVTSSAGEVRIRWQAETFDAGLPANFAITLYPDGGIRYDYGTGNTGLTPTVGMSRSHSGDLLLASSHDGEAVLTNANSLQFELAGSQIPPGMTLSTAGVLSGTPTATGVYSLRVRVSDSAARYDQELYTLAVLDLSLPAKLRRPTL